MQLALVDEMPSWRWLCNISRSSGFRLNDTPFRRAIRPGSMGASSEDKPVLFDEIVRDVPGWPPLKGPSTQANYRRYL